MSSSASDIQVQDRAMEFAEEVNSAARAADNEDELRIDVERAIRELASDLEMEVDPENERTVLSGRPDAVYGDLVIEYKDPDHPGDWVDEAYNGRDENDNGLVDYMYDIAVERAHNLEEQEAILDQMVGVGTNGHKIFFCRYHPQQRVESIESGQATLSGLTKNEAQSGIEVIEVYDIQDGARTFLTYLRSLSRKPLTSSKLAESFGPEGDVAKEVVNQIYTTLQESREEDNPKVSTLYNEWNRVFGIVYGEDIDLVRDDRQLFGNLYNIEDPDVKPLLFSVQTYYGLLMKMLVTDLLASVRNAPIEEAGLYEPDDDILKEKLQKVEKGEQFERAGLENFFEEGFFGWYLSAWDEDVASSVRQLAEELIQFEPRTAAIKPEVVRDILKDLYQDLVPRDVRHGLGEFLTPDWLAEYIIDQTGFEGDGSVLDPACGSGTFLVEAIDIVRQNSDEDDEAELLQKILDNVAGYDLNPISVIASRTNYLIALGDLAFEKSSMRIPIYQSDSILTPSKYVDITSINSGGSSLSVMSREGVFKIPRLDSQGEIEDLLSLTSSHIEMGSSPDEFMNVVDSELDIDDSYEQQVTELFEKIQGLDDDNRNGIWTELLRNRLAPEYMGEFDYVVGNPPYVSWENLSQEYREITEDIWDEYNLFEFGGYEAGISRDDISILMTYVAIDEYLNDNGTLGFVIPQSLFKSHRGGYGFRQFKISKPQSTCPLSVNEVDDLSRFDPFDASNQTAVVVIKKGVETDYPVPYRIWNQNSTIRFDDTLQEALDKVDMIDVVGEPVQEGDPQSEWLTLEPEAIKAVRKVLGQSELTGREGVNTLGADGLYHVDLLMEEGNKFKIENIPEEGRQQAILDKGEVERNIDKDLIYPSVKGRHIDKWTRDGALHLLIPHKNERGPHNGIPESEMRQNYSSSYQFFQEWESVLRDTRSQNSKFYDKSKDPFYLMDNVGEYTFAPYKAAWRELRSGEVQSAVLEPADEGLGREKPIANTHKVMFIPFQERKPAHLATAILNSSITELVLRGYTGTITGLSPHILETINIPRYDPNNSSHVELAELSIEAHNTSSGSEINRIEDQIDNVLADMWNITDEELEQIGESIAFIN
ncbi:MULTISPECIES: Eco57I restriction-modification methylase domain-containing protein [Halorubrum]|uniref:Eco57I restriction-modification methylase domain-containing protein n=1 Tax=Halorubrum TaxID=56688 RepID=UPI00135F15D5|nr:MULTISPECIES: N-6 DNA methylase [Halorubrum]